MNRPRDLLAGSRIGAVLLCLAAACSTADRDPVLECENDSDCATGSLCSLDTNTCVPEVLAPRSVLSFDINETGLRTEINGCDPEVSRELGGSQLRVAKHSSLFQSFELRAEKVDAILNGCTPATCTGVCDSENLTCTQQLDADLELRMDSRLGLDPVVSPEKNYSSTPETPPAEGELPPPVVFGWPRYSTTTDLGARAVTRLRVEPSLEQTTIGRFYRAIAPDAGEAIVASGIERCMRGVSSDEARVKTLAGTPIPNATIEFFYDEPIATPSTVIGTGQSCASIDDCDIGWACNLDFGRCGLDLTRLPAGSTVSLTDEEGEVGSFLPALMYTYCEEFISDIEPLDRQFFVRVKPPDSSGLPTVNYLLSQDFQPGQPGVIPPDQLTSDLCMPNWRSPQTVSFSFNGAPVALRETELGEYACCSTDCLPSGDPDAEPIPPPSVESCSSFDSTVFETLWINEEESWPFQNCVPTDTAGSGRYVRNLASEDGQCPIDGCSVSLTPGDEDELTRNYTVSIEQPPNSVFRSQRFTIMMTAETAELPVFELEPRVLLRGRVECEKDECSTTNAVIAAEQLRTLTPDSEIPGPFFFDTRVDETGQFVLPVDPGLYVLTAYPAVSEAGAPAPYRIIDVREGSEDVEDVDGVPTAQLATPFVLEEGLLVRVQLRDFDSTTTVTPIDTGSWTYQSDFPVEADLNDPATCLTSSTRGCNIRRLRPTDTPLPLLLASQFQFTTRDRGSDSCPE